MPLVAAGSSDDQGRGYLPRSFKERAVAALLAGRGIVLAVEGEVDEPPEVVGAADARADLAHPSPAALLAVAESIGKDRASCCRRALPPASGRTT